MPGIYDIAGEFDGDAFGDTLKAAGVEYINFFAKCNLGFCYFPTQVGTVYPGLKRDLLGEVIEACHSRGIGVSAYFNVGLSHETALRHREWCTVDQSGRVYDFEKRDHWFRTMCFNSGYYEYILALIDEVLTRYPVDGIICDSMNTPVCYGVECLDEMRRNGLDINDPESFKRQAWLSTMKMRDAIDALAVRRNPDLWRFYLGVPARYQPTHNEMEILPQGGWGYDYMPWYVRYMRTLERPFSLMTGRFQRSWGDLSGLRPQAALAYDCYYALACGANVSVGDHLHPRGQLKTAVYESIGSLYREITELDEWTQNCRSVAEVLVVAPWLAEPYNEERGNIMRGLGRMLCELKCQFDVSDGAVDFGKYRLLILPDAVELTLGLAARIDEFIENGGMVISSGFSGVDRRTGRFLIGVLDDAVEVLGGETENYTFIHFEDLRGDLPDMELPCYTAGAAIRLREYAPGAEAHGRLFKGYFKYQDFDYRHEYLYIPEDSELPRPPLVSVAGGRVWHFGNTLGKAYYDYASTALRDWLGNLLKKLMPEPVLSVSSLPSFGMASLMRQEKRLIVHLLNYVPEKRGGKMEIIEDALPATGVELIVKIPADMTVTQVYSAPDRGNIEFTRTGDRVRIKVPDFKGHTHIVFE